MSGTPTMIVLYDTDAVEVRCMDGSRLELSPCGATMIYQPPLKKGDHPRQGVSSRIHKRTRFVTSDHKKLVVQSLDFRNRFALRPYLCEELINKDDVLTLYASVDSTRWPDSLDNTNVEILADGSRKITSLDDFASLVVSPHGQDFSISYLSRISFDDKDRDSNSQQFLQSSNVSYCLSRNRTELSSTNSGGDGKPSCVEKNNEAIVQPFQLSVESQHRPVSPYTKSLQSCTGDDRARGSQFEFGVCEDINKLSFSSDHDVTLTEEVALGLENSKNSESCNDGGEDKNDNHDRCLAQNDDNKVLVSPRLHDESVMVPGSPTTHDISSISRSSTPDGLRTTIDSDATLIHDHNEVDQVFTGQRIMHQHYRHSSPTHCSSPFDDIHKLSLINLDGQSTKQKAPSLDGSYLGNEQRRLSPVGQDGSAACGGNSSHQFSVNVPSNSETAQKSVNQLVSKERVKDIGQDTADFRSESTETPSDIDHPLKASQSSTSDTDCNSGQILQMNINIPTTKTARFLPRSQGNSLSKSGINLCKGEDEIQKYPESFSSRVQSVRVLHGHQDSLSISCHSQNSPRPVSTVVESEAEEESASRKKYTWVTTHASRNCCPREWVHALMLALKTGSTGRDKELPRRKESKEKYKQCIVPKPLPLTCPFQHKHRTASCSNSAHESPVDAGSKMVEESFTSSIGEFQQGRLKVVLSEGIIYRLTSCNELTVVEVYPGDGTVLVSQGVKAIFFTHFIPRTNMLEERTYSLKSLPPGCAKGRHSIEKMMKTANRLVQICLSWDKRCGKGKPPCWQKEIVAVVAPLSSSLLEECCVNGLGRFSAFTNGRVRIVFDDRTALDTVADFRPRLGNMMEVHQNKLYTSESGATTARLLVTSGNYITVEINKPGPYAKYLSAAKEWIAWVNASQTERQEFYKQQNQPHIIQQAAELELKKIFCFNYIVEHTAGLSAQANQDAEAMPNKTAKDTDNQSPGANNKALLTHIPNSSSLNKPLISKDHHHHHRVQQLQPNLPNPASCPSPAQPHHHHNHNNNNRIVSPILPYLSHLSSIHPSTPSTLPSPHTAIASPYNHNQHHPTASSTPLHPQASFPQKTYDTRHFSSSHSNDNNTQQSSAFPHDTYHKPFPHSNTQHVPVPSNTGLYHHNAQYHTPLSNTPHEDKCVNTTMGFQSVRSALARTSSLINDIEMFLEDTKS